MLIANALCPNCGAPLGLREEQRHVFCAYCDVSLMVEPTPPSPAGAAASAKSATLRRQEVSAEEVAHIKQLVLDGRCDEAIAHFAGVTDISTSEAEEAVSQLLLPTLTSLMQQLPINAIGFVLTFVIVGACGASAAWSASEAMAGSWEYWILALVCAAGAVRQLVWFLPKAFSTAVAAFGAKGHARVLKCAILRPALPTGGTPVLVAFEVTPARGGPPFVDEEVLLLSNESLEKVKPGNVLRVRYNEPGRSRVFPVSPVDVIGRPEDRPASIFEG